MKILISTKPPKYSYILAIILGMFAFVIGAMGPGLIGVFIIFLLTGSLFGFFWPYESWRWGLWISGPLVALLGLSVIFAGNLNSFVQNDLPILLLAISAACLGSFVTAHFKGKQSKAPK